MSERGRGVSSIGQAFLGLTGGYNRVTPIGSMRGRGLEQFGQAFTAGGGESGTPPVPAEEQKLFRKWWYEYDEQDRNKLGYQAMLSIMQTMESWRKIMGEGMAEAVPGGSDANNVSEG